MADAGNGSLQLSSSELCVEHKVSDSEMNVGNKRRKVSVSTPVAVESDNPEAHMEPVVMKRKRMSGHSFKKKFNEEIVPAKLALGQTEKLTSYKEKEQVPSNSKEGCLNQILPEQKQAAEDKCPGNEIDCLRNKIKKKCRKRMAKLFQKQGVQCQEFEQIWEKKRSNLERDYKLELSIIRSIYGEDITRTDNKLELLDGRFLKKMKEHTLLKDVEFKKLKAEQLAARDEERQKRAHWLAACRSGEPMADHGPESLGPHSEDVGHGNSSSTDPLNDLGVALSQASVLAGVEQLNQLKNLCHQQIICALPAFPKSVPSKIGAVELNKEVPPKVPETVAKEIVDYANPVELSNSTSYEGIDNRDAIGLPDASVTLGDKIDEGVGLPLVEQILEPSEQTKASWTPHHCTSVLPQTSEDQVPCSSISDIIQDVGAQVNPVQDRSAQEVGNPTASPSEVAALMQISEDQVPCSSISDIIQDVGAQVNPVQDRSAQEVGNPTASPSEVAASVHVNILQPNIELHDQDATDTSQGEVANLQSSDKFQDRDATGLEDQTTSWIEVANSESIDVVNPVQSSVGAPAVLNCEELLSVDVFPSCDEPPFIDVESQSHNLGRSSSQTSEIADTVVVSHESASQVWENRDLGSESQVIHETSVRVSTSSRNNVGASQVVNTVELPHQAGLQLGSVGNHYGSGNPFPHNQFTSSSSPPLYAAPLQHELGKISKEIEQLQKSHEDMKSQLKSDREKEIVEMLAQINSKYNLKLQEAETEFSVKKNGLDKNRGKVLMNRVLAECFNSICGDHYWLRRIQQAAPSSSMQPQTLQHLVRPPPPMAMGHQPVLGQPMATPNIQALQQLLLSNPTRHSPITPSPLQTPQHAPAFSFVSSSQPLRPLLISAITPTPTNPGFGGNIRSGAPHLQSHAASYMPTPGFPSIFQHRASQSLQSPPPPPPPMQPPTFQNRPQIPTLLNPSVSAPDFLMDMDDTPNVPASSSLPQMNSSFGSLEHSHLARDGNVQGNWTSSAAVNTICLSDDD